MNKIDSTGEGNAPREIRHEVRHINHAWSIYLGDKFIAGDFASHGAALDAAETADYDLVNKANQPQKEWAAIGRKPILKITNP